MDSLTGIGFRPLDEEIIDLLKKKRLDRGFSVETIKEIDFYSFDPWDLAGKYHAQQALYDVIGVSPVANILG